MSRNTLTLQRLMREPDPVVGEHRRELELATLKSDDHIRDPGAEFLAYSPEQPVLSASYTTSMMNCGMHLSPLLQRCRPGARYDPVFFIPCLHRHSGEHDPDRQLDRVQHDHILPAPDGLA